MSYLTVVETADALGITRQAVLKLIKTGKLKSVPEMSGGKIARHLVPMDSVNARRHALMPPPGLQPVRLAAEAAGVDSSTVRRWIRDGEIDAFESAHAGSYVDVDAVVARVAGSS